MPDTKMTDHALESWTRVAVTPVGGLTEVGFSDDECFLLVVSWQGRGLIDTRTGERVARDSDEPQTGWRNDKDGTVLGIGPLDGVPIRCVGLWGRSLSTRVDSVAMQVTGEEVRLYDEHVGTFRVLQRPVTDVRAAGFSPSGHVLVIATSSDVEIYRRS